MTKYVQVSTSNINIFDIVYHRVSIVCNHVVLANKPVAPHPPSLSLLITPPPSLLPPPILASHLS